MRGKTPNSNTQASEKLQISIVCVIPRFWRTALLVLVLFALVLPRMLYAHGELLIRIAAITRQIRTNATPQLYLQRGELYRIDKNWDAAEADYTQAAQLGAHLDPLDLCRARLLADEEQFQSAKMVLDRIVQRSPNNGDALIARARALIKIGERESALLDFSSGLAIAAEVDADVYLEFAQALAADGRITEALQRLDEGLAKLGPVIALQSYAMDLEIGRNNTDAALARLQTIIEHADRKERWLSRRGEIQLAAGRAGEARLSYESALAAIKGLPKLLQRSPAMLALQSQINSALALIAGSSPPIGKVETR